MDRNKFAEERKRFPGALNRVYLETGGTGLVPDYVYEGIKHYQDGRYYIGGDADWGGYGTVKMMEYSRASLAKMLGTEPEDIFFGSNTSQLFGIAASGLELHPGDNILVSDLGFFGQNYVWHFRQREGVELRHVPCEHGQITLEMIQKYADERTQVVSLDFVENSTGYRIDAQEIGEWCHSRGIWFMTDAAQASGVMPIDVRNMHIDFLAGSDYKWMMNYGGTGYACISEDLRNVLKQHSAGWMGDRELFVVKDHPELSSSASRYEYGYPNVSGIYGIGKTAQRYNELGCEDIEEYVLYMNQYLEEKVRDISGVGFWSSYSLKNRSGIMILTLDETIPATNQTLKDAGIAANITNGKIYGSDRAIRIAVHYYNNTDDLDALVSVLKGV